MPGIKIAAGPGERRLAGVGLPGVRAKREVVHVVNARNGARTPQKSLLFAANIPVVALRPHSYT